MDFARRLVKALEVPHTREERAPSDLQFVSSDGLLPVPIEERAWTAFSYVAFWASTSLYSQINVGTIWYGVQSSIGSSCVLVMLRAIWPSVNDIPNSMPLSSGTNTRDFMCFLIFWVIYLPFIWPPVHTIRHFFTFKTIFAPIACLIFMIWCIVKAKGVGPIVKQSATIHGSELAWAMMSSVGICLSNFIALTVNAPDFGSRAKTPSAPAISQLWSILLSYGLVCLFGVVVSSSSQTIYGEVIWSPVDLLGTLLDDNPSPATRFGVWFIAFSFIMAQIVANICANS
ncbi:permease for cytosine/purines, uracil, thiamine, allantoin-domain-containing protein, partial [Suillus variegatus]